MYRHYQRAECVTFRKTKEEFGGLSNMAGGYPIPLGDLVARSSEALYQAARFPHRPEVQESILAQHSPMTAKMKSKPFRRDSRSDWDAVRVRVMRWVLRAKLYSNVGFRDLLLATGERTIVEDSRKDRYWGAVPEGTDLLIGENVLGRLLMELRDELRFERHCAGHVLPPPDIERFLFLGAPAPPVACRWLVSESADSCGTRESLPLFSAAAVDREPEAAAPSGATRLDGGSDIDDEYLDLVRQLSALTKSEAAEALRRVAESTPEFSPAQFRRTLQQISDGDLAPALTPHAARILRAQRALLDKLAQPSLL